MNTNPPISPVKNSKLHLCVLKYGCLIFAYPLFATTFAISYGDTLILQKAIVRWLFPMGILFLVCVAMLAVGFSSRNRWAKLLGVLGIAVCLSSTDPITRWIVGSLENQYPDIAANESLQPFDNIVVLGGGTGITTSERPQVNRAGERILLAARLYHAKVTRGLVITGDSLIATDTLYDSPRTQSIYLLSGLGVDKNNIHTLHGRNTQQEIDSLRAQPHLWEGKRCGLLTSAIHLPRAMRLARQAGVDVIPIPADFRQPNTWMHPLSFIPSAENLDYITQAVYEYIGMAVGR